MASSSSAVQRPPRRDIFEASLHGAQQRPFIPRLRADPPAYQPVPHNLLEFRALEGERNRELRLRQLFRSLPQHPRPDHDDADDEAVADSAAYAVHDDRALTQESAKRLEEMYQDELYSRFRKHKFGFLHRNVGWAEFSAVCGHQGGRCVSGYPLPYTRADSGRCAAGE